MAAATCKASEGAVVVGGGRWRDTTVGGTGGAVVGVGSLPQDAAAQHGGGYVQGIGGRPRSVGGGSRVRPGQVADLRGGVGGGPGGVLPDRVTLLGGQVRTHAVGSGPVRCPPLPQLGPGQVRREFPAAVPYRATVLGGVAGQRDRVPGDLTRVGDAEPFAHQHPGLVQAGEELVLAVRGGGGGGHLPSQRDPRGLVQATAGGLIVLGAGRGGGGGGGGRPARGAARRPGGRRVPCPVPRTGGASRRPGGPASRPRG